MCWRNTCQTIILVLEMDHFDGVFTSVIILKCMLHCSLLKLEELERYIVHVTQTEQVSLICEPVTLGVFIYPYIHVYTHNVLDYFYVHYHDGLYQAFSTIFSDVPLDCMKIQGVPPVA